MIIKEDQIEPLADRVIVKRDPEITQTPGGIFIPDTCTDKPMVGTIVAVGPGRTNESGTIIPMNVVVGDRVLFAQYAGVEIVDDPLGSILLMHEKDILGKLHESTKSSKTPEALKAYSNAIPEDLPETVEQDIRNGMEGVTI